MAAGLGRTGLGGIDARPSLAVPLRHLLAVEPLVDSPVWAGVSTPLTRRKAQRKPVPARECVGSDLTPPPMPAVRGGSLPATVGMRKDHEIER